MTNLREPLNSDDAALDAALRHLHSNVLSEPVPPALKLAADRLAEMKAQQERGQRWFGMAAGVLMAFALGWFTSAQTQLREDGAGSLAGAGTSHEFVRQAGFAHAVYQPEKRHPVEVAANEQEHLVQWLSKRLGKPLKIPQLDAQGFELVGGRLLPGDSGARAQFMFQNSQGQRVTLYLGALEADSSGASMADLQATQFRYESAGPVPSFYWAEQGFGYALSGAVEKSILMALATLVYSQIH